MLTYLHVRAISPRAVRGLLTAGTLRLPCFIGRSGVTWRKREGDGATPAGCFTLRRIMYRNDRIPMPQSRLPKRPITPVDGWCEAPADRNYNRPVRLPYAASRESMARGDALYDIVVILSHNERPRIKGAGSAIFFHLEAARPTAGCVAVSLADMRKILALCGPRTRMIIGPCARRKSPSPPAHGWRRN
jgi:L,D-peptidoglycan transpeptidase YkuD (ErfK/YbiS/YcfS/YnhG family)